MVPHEMAVCQRGLLLRAVGQTSLASPVSWLVVQLGFREVAAHQVPRGSNLAMTSHPSLVVQLLEAPVTTL